MSDHMSDQLRAWSPGQAMLPPDPNHHNRMLDRGAAEHLREVAPGLAASPASAPAPPADKYGVTIPCPGCGVPLPSGAHHVCYAPPAPVPCASCGGTGTVEYGNDFDPGAGPIGSEPCEDCAPPAPAAPAEAKDPSVETTIRTEVRRHPVGGYDYVHVERAAPAPPAEATGEMSREEVVGFLSAVQDASIDADPRWLDNGVSAVLANDRALRARAREAEEERDNANEERDAYGALVAELRRERDEAREQRDDLSRENGALRAQRDDAIFRADLSNEAVRDADRMLSIERAARLKAEAELDGALTEANDLRLRVERLVEGAAKLTERAEEAEEELRLADFRVKSAESRSDDFAARLAAAEAEVSVLREFHAHHDCSRLACALSAKIAEIAALRERAERLEEAGDVLRNFARRFRSMVYGPEEIDRAIADWAAAKGTK